MLISQNIFNILFNIFYTDSTIYIHTYFLSLLIFKIFKIVCCFCSFIIEFIIGFLEYIFLMNFIIPLNVFIYKLINGITIDIYFIINRITKEQIISS